MVARMKQANLPEPGKLVLEEVDIPVPREGEVLVKVSRCGVCGSDISGFHGKHPYIHCPIVLGHEFSGTVTGAGPGVTGPAAGTRVTVIPHVVCGECDACHAQKYNCCGKLKVMGAQMTGAYAEYVNVPAEMALAIPSSVSMDDAALVEPASVGYHAAGRGNVGPDDAILVMGAGPIGVFTMQACRALGAARVLIADLDGSRLDLAGRLGADGTIDLAREELAEGLDRLAGGGGKIDLFFDCVGGRGDAFDAILRTARRGSRLVIVGVLYPDYQVPHLPDIVEHELSIAGTAMYTPRDYREVIELMAAGEIRTAGIITHYYDFERIVDAFARIESGQEKFFKIMFKMEP
ncbi:MAG: alcohol dehydrogenase catalytic domain-containing protein [Phycisphaerae bacterium]|nr:alcohol dehydrogenase catalytic domain-containing protein [Phycisphaerae bacterium]